MPNSAVTASQPVNIPVGDLRRATIRMAGDVIVDWEMLQVILGAVKTPKFTFTAIDPRTFNTQHTGNYYVGDRTGDANYYLVEKDDIAQFSLKLKFIEY